MRRSARDVLGRLLGRRNAIEGLEIRQSDIFIVSYPRSGNTWLRFILANLLHPEGVASFANIEALVPDIHKNTDAVLRRMSGPRLLKSHAAFEPSYPRVLYLCRDPRDVAVSDYYYLLTRSQLANESMEEYLDLFLQGQVGNGVSWRDHVEGWWGSRPEADNLLLVRYEDMLDDAVGQLTRIVAFAGLEQSTAAIEAAIQKASLRNMKESERVHGHAHRATRHTKEGIPFVRSGSKGQWRKEIPSDFVRAMTEIWGDTMSKLGYEDETNGSGN